MTELIKSFLKDPIQFFGCAILAIFMVGLLIRYGKAVWDEIVND